MAGIITIDSREPDLGLSFSDEWLIQKKELEAGDFEILTAEGHCILIERKTASDLLSSIADGRLLSQTARMKGITPWSYLVIEGFMEPTYKGLVSLNDETTKWTWASVQGALMTVQELGVFITSCIGHDSDLVPTVELIAKRSRKEVPIIPARAPYLFSPGELILSSLPGIGVKRAAKLMKVFNGNVALALTALTDAGDNKTRDGVGPKTRKKIIEALGGSVSYVT